MTNNIKNKILILGILLVLIFSSISSLGAMISPVLAQSCGGSAQCGELQYTNCPPGCTSVVCGCTASCNSLFNIGCVAGGGFCTPDPFLGCGCYNGSCYVVTQTPTPTPVGPLCDGWASPNSCHQNSGDGCYYRCNSAGTAWEGPSGPGCSGSCGGGPGGTPTPPPSGGSCSGITYTFDPASPFSEGVTINVDIDRSSGSSCFGNWNNVGLRIDGVAVSPNPIGLCYQDGTTNCSQGYSAQFDPGTVGSHTLQLTVNNNTCACNIANFETEEAAECSFDLTDVTLNGNGVTTGGYLSNIVTTGGSIDYVDFVSTDPAIATVTSPDLAASFQTDVTSVSFGSTTYTATATMDDGITTCANTGNIDVSNPAAWWQAGNASIYAGSSIFSDISYQSCYANATCDPNLISFDDSNDEYPGVAIAGSGSVSAGSGNVSEKDPSPVYNWTAEGADFANLSDYTYSFFEDRVPNDYLSVDPGSNISSNSLGSGGYVDSKGYRWYKHAGPLTIDAAQTLGTNKVILFVDGNVTINNTINFADGQGFFLLVTTGEITVSETVGGDIASFSTNTPELEGLYYADGAFSSGSLGSELDTLFLHLRGSLVAGNINLDRSLIDNSTVPGEYFEYGADVIMHMPRELRVKRIRWREVAP